MKKLLSLVLALTLALSLSVTAFATGVEGDTGTDNTNTFSPGDTGGKDTTVTYTVAPAYTVTIPASVTIGSSGSITATVSAENVKVAYGKQVVVKLTGINNTTSDTTFTVETKEGASLTYTVKKDNDTDTISKGDTVLTVASGLNNETGQDGTLTGASKGSATLTFALADTVQYAGTYSGTVTFTVSVEDVPTAP
ncbi:MAG: hypothetical protein Q4D50_05245 [Eubacteriales bacterium]|nr:hypothetical protein [Eubacteriales bacterium]